MLLKKIQIINTSDQDVIRTVDFKLGANFIVDSSDSKHHNKVGKTTFLRLIDIALGARDKKAIYTDTQTGSVEKSLRDYIEQHKTSVKLEVVEDFYKDENSKILEVGLYSRSFQKVDGKKLNIDEYRKKLNLLFFKNHNNRPTFRQLINSFIRISMNGDNSTFLKNIPNGTKENYRTIYNYLFNISDTTIDVEREKLTKEINALKRDETRYKHQQNIDDLSQLEQIINILKVQKKVTQEKLSDIVSSTYFIKNRDHINDIRLEYTNITNQINEIQYKIDLNKRAIKDVEIEQNKSVSSDLTKNFFEEVKSLIPKVDKSFQELLSFNKKLNQNKIDYLSTIIENLTQKQNSLSKKQELLIEGNTELISLVQNNKINDYEKLLAELSKRDQEISSMETVWKTLNNYEKEKNSNLNKLELLNKKVATGKSYKLSMQKFNRYFTEFASKINDERPVLTYSNDPAKFPLATTDINGSSTGTLKSLIAAYDLAYQQFAFDEEKPIPNFIIHDVMENIESPNLESIIKIANNEMHGQCQYVVSILEENYKLASSENEEQNKILELSDKHKLFNI